MALGFQIAAISPDTPDKLQPTVDKNELDYAIYSDAGLAAAKAYGIAFQLDAKTEEQYKKFGIPLGDPAMLPVPAVLLYDGEGKLAFEYVHPDYTIRLAPEVLLAAARAAVE